MSEPDPQEGGLKQTFYQRLTAFETVLLGGGFVLFLVLLYTLAVPGAEGSLLSPPLIAVAAVILLWPLRAHHTVRSLLFAGGFLLLMWFLVRLSSVLLPFAVVYLLAYLFNPLVTQLLERFRVPRWASALGVTLLSLGVVALFVFLLVPNIVGELKTLATRLVDSFNGLRTWLATTPILDRLEESGLMVKDEFNARLGTFIQEEANKLARSIPNFVQGAFRSISSLLGLITTLAIIPVLLFYMLKDYPFIHRRVVELFPTLGGTRDYLARAGLIVGSYLRGQLLISAIAAFNVTTVLFLFGAPFALLIGLLGGLLNMIPNLGMIITLVIGGLVALIFGDPWYIDLLIIVGTLLGQSLLEGSVLTPKIMSHQVGLHPVLILLSLFVFGYFLGIFGLLIAVPASAIIMTAYKSYRDDLTLDLMDHEHPTMKWFRRRARRKSRTAETPPPPPAPKDES